MFMYCIYHIKIIRVAILICIYTQAKQNIEILRCVPKPSSSGSVLT